LLHMGVYSNLQIEDAIKAGHIVCAPFNKKHVSHASLDVTLGHYYYRTERAEGHPVYNPFDESDVKRYFEGALANTHEFFGILPPGACEVKSRSSWGRNGVAVCFDAGWIDPGYINRLTLEIYNLNQNEIILLPVGERIAQIIFHETGEVAGNYGKGRDAGFSGKYQTGTDLPTLIKTWTPDLMLPRAYKDKRSMPLPIKGLKKL
jgi:deoxycytidine triphosphate deaminase